MKKISASTLTKLTLDSAERKAMVSESLLKCTLDTVKLGGGNAGLTTDLLVIYAEDKSSSALYDHKPFDHILGDEGGRDIVMNLHTICSAEDLTMWGDLMHAEGIVQDGGVKGYLSYIGTMSFYLKAMLIFSPSDFCKFLECCRVGGPKKHWHPGKAWHLSIQKMCDGLDSSQNFLKTTSEACMLLSYFLSADDVKDVKVIEGMAKTYLEMFDHPSRYVSAYNYIKRSDTIFESFPEKAQAVYQRLQTPLVGLINFNTHDMIYLTGLRRVKTILSTDSNHDMHKKHLDSLTDEFHAVKKAVIEEVEEQESGMSYGYGL